MHILDTPRLRIRQFERTDAPFIINLLNSPGWLRHIGDRYVHTHDKAILYLEKGPMASYAVHGFGLWHVALHDGTPIGMCGILRRQGLDIPDLGFAFLTEYHGQGYAREAASACRDFGFQNLALPQLAAITNPDNQASIHLLTHIGFHYQGQIQLPGIDEKQALYICAAK